MVKADLYPLAITLLSPQVWSLGKGLGHSTSQLLTKGASTAKLGATKEAANPNSNPSPNPDPNPIPIPNQVPRARN